MGESEYEKILDRFKKQKTAQSAHTVLNNPIDGDLAAESLAIGKKLNLPPAAILATPEVYRQRYEHQTTLESLERAPKLADWLTMNPIHSGLGKSDIASLSATEGLIGDFKMAMDAAVTGGYLYTDARVKQDRLDDFRQRRSDIELGLGEIKESEISKIATGADRKFYQHNVYSLMSDYGSAYVNSLTRYLTSRLMLRSDKVYDKHEANLETAASKSLERVQDNSDRIATSYASTLDVQKMDQVYSEVREREGGLNQLMGLAEMAMDNPSDFAEWVASTIVKSTPSLAAGTLATIATRKPTVGAAVQAATTYKVSQDTTFQNLVKEGGFDLSRPEDRIKFLNSKEFRDRLNDRVFAYSATIGIVEAVGGKLAAKKLAESPVGDIILQGLTQATLGSGGEALALFASDQEVNIADVALEGIIEFGTAIPEMAGVGGRNLAREIIRSSRYGRTADFINRIDEAVSQSSLREKSPEKFAEAISAAGGGDIELHVPSDRLNEYFQEQGIEITDEIMRLWGIDPDEFSDSLETGSPIAIPVTSYATNIQGTEHSQWVMENASASSDELSISEAALFNDRFQDEMNDAFELYEAREESELAQRSDREQIYSNMFSQLRSAGQGVDAANSQALLFSSFWNSAGDRLGEMPLDLSESMGLEVKGFDRFKAARRRGRLDAMINTLRKNPEKALKPTGLGVLDFVRSLGGVLDRGGDIEALDPPKGILRESRADIDNAENQPDLIGSSTDGKKGLNLDEIGRAMIEAGYFPEYQGGADLNADGTVIDEASIALQAISEAISGRDRFAGSDGVDPELSSLMGDISRRGIDLAMSNDEIIQRLNSPEKVEIFQQAGVDQAVIDVDVEGEGRRSLPVLEVKAIIEKRISDAKDILECMNG